jgi:hypothetical protein
METKTDSFKNSVISKVIFILLLLFSIHFWNLKYIPQKFNLENIFVWVLCGASFFLIDRKNKMRFTIFIIIFLVGLLLNAYASRHNFGQGYKLSILSFSYFYFIMLYFLLHYLELDRKFMENTVIVFALLYSLIFIIQYKVFPYELFNRWVKTAADEMQFEIVGHGFLMLGFYLVFNRFMANKRLIYVFLALGFFIVLFKCGFRTLIASAAFVALLMGLRLMRFKISDLALAFLAMILFAGLTQYKSINTIIKNSINKTESEEKMGKSYVRNVEREFFFKKYPKDLSYFIIGGGKPAGKENIDNFNPFAIGLNYNIVWVDIGLLGFFVVVGGIATFGILMYTLIGVFIRLPRDAIYLNAYFLYLLLTSLTNEEIYREGIFSVVAIALYLIDKVKNESAKTSETRTEVPALEPVKANLISEF